MRPDRDGGGRRRAGRPGARVYRGGVGLLAAVLIVLGLVLFVRAAVSGKPIGFLIGALFVAAGAGRLYLLRRQ